MSKKNTEKKTGQLYGNLFTAYDDHAYRNSFELFRKRFEANRFPVKWFKNKICLDGGCGGGRYCLALSALGTKRVYGIDISESAIKDARKRARKLNIANVDFRVASVENIPFDDKSFDSAIVSGVLHHVVNPEKAMSEISRVIKSHGMLYMLVYATEGVWWPLVQILRPLAFTIGFDLMDRAVSRAGLPVNKRRIYLDDLFVPRIDFYTWDRLKCLLERHGFNKITRWKKGRFDHEDSLESYYADLKGFLAIFQAGRDANIPESSKFSRIFDSGVLACEGFLDFVEKMLKAKKNGRITEKRAMQIIIGQGHHRIIAWKK